MKKTIGHFAPLLGPGAILSTSINVGLAETFMWLGNVSVDQASSLSLRGRVSGSFNDAWSLGHHSEPDLEILSGFITTTKQY
jgi:hypothetical protein